MLFQVMTGTSVKTAIGFEDEQYWAEVAKNTDAKSRFLINARKLLMTSKFDAVLGIVIVINSVMIGVEANRSVKGGDLTEFVPFQASSGYTLDR